MVHPTTSPGTSLACRTVPRVRRILRVPHGNAIEERRQVLQPQAAIGDVVHPPVARLAIERRRGAQVSQRLARPARPRDAMQPLRGAAHRQPMPHDAKGEVASDDVGARKREISIGRQRQEDAVDEASHTRCRVQSR